MAKSTGQTNGTKKMLKSNSNWGKYPYLFPIKKKMNCTHARGGEEMGLCENPRECELTISSLYGDSMAITTIVGPETSSS